MVILRMDMNTLVHFRQVSLRAREVVGLLHEYRIIASSALNCFCALLRTSAAFHITLSDFYHRLCEQTCSICGDGFGDLVNLLT
ncbi:uncharacterized protein K452DRAFT_22863 [Aplosporella prunicola CBS 121167]|uniref:Uncharacterized protein n=1 Tax=Aplosporella prunicola CBS 121167 TaxID=1176127 RepID=A0A6A6AVZ9_9PEZI|nr:uncharacterized protein K452DRAFT_22863 [Aplosporella prunicola CBS 121167]KAF2135418.1 hypothetical protein K452DRAFT_22863 [Aplosporella prunicola CBS 121167]